MNIASVYTLDEWHSWLLRYTRRSLVLAQDMQGQAVAVFRVNALGTKVIIDRNGHIVYRSAGTAGYDALNAAVKEAL